MPKKTDTKLSTRSRIHCACKPEIQMLLSYVNLFPAVDEWINVEKPFRLFQPHLLLRQEPSPDFEDKKFEWQKKMVDAGLLLSEAISSKIGALAHSQIVINEELKKIISLADKWDKTGEDAAKAREMLQITKNDFYKKEVLLKLEQLRQCNKDFYKYASNISETWFHRYNKVKQIKNFLTQLAFISRNFESAEKNLTDLGLIELNDLTTNIYVDENGILQRKENIVVQWLLGVDVRRIRQCAICRNLFWANRIDRQCCTKKCADVHNQRNSRDRKQIHGSQYRQAAKKKLLLKKA